MKGRDRLSIDLAQYGLNKRAQIVILRPSVGTGHLSWTGYGWVDTKEGWDIRTTYADHPSVDSWDPLWRWAFAP